MVVSYIPPHGGLEPNFFKPIVTPTASPRGPPKSVDQERDRAAALVEGYEATSSVTK